MVRTWTEAVAREMAGGLPETDWRGVLTGRWREVEKAVGSEGPVARTSKCTVVFTEPVLLEGLLCTKFYIRNQLALVPQPLSCWHEDVHTSAQLPPDLLE